jgi:hypothetical protein
MLANLMLVTKDIDDPKVGLKEVMWAYEDDDR